MFGAAIGFGTTLGRGDVGQHAPLHGEEMGSHRPAQTHTWRDRRHRRRSAHSRAHTRRHTHAHAHAHTHARRCRPALSTSLLPSPFAGLLLFAPALNAYAVITKGGVVMGGQAGGDHLITVSPQLTLR
jgi:hypothetical protein